MHEIEKTRSTHGSKLGKKMSFAISIHCNLQHFLFRLKLIKVPDLWRGNENCKSLISYLFDEKKEIRCSLDAGTLSVSNTRKREFLTEMIVMIRCWAIAQQWPITLSRSLTWFFLQGWTLKSSRQNVCRQEKPFW